MGDWRQWSRHDTSFDQATYLGQARVRIIGTIALLTAVTFSSAACNESGDSRTTARVDRLTDSELCIVPEDKQQTALSGCFKASRDDISKLKRDDCIELRIPYPQAEGRNAYSIRVLDRACKR